MATDNKFEGWAAVGKDSIEGNLKWQEYEPKTWMEDDVELKILYCGVCGSDLHTMSGGWGDMSAMYPQVVGHEIVGEVVRVGKDVTHLKLGDIAGVGAQCDSCGHCHQCSKEWENYCDNGQTGTYAGKFTKGPATGDKSYGGYANFWRGPAHFTVAIPAELDPAEAAPMLCGGTTLYQPLETYGAGTTAKDVGIVGLGGLGHFGVLFAKAMGANVTVITHGTSKIEDAKKLGADHVIVTGDKPDEAVLPHRRTLDLIISTSNDKNLPVPAYLQLIRPHGHFIMVGAPEVSALPSVHPFQHIMNAVSVGGSAIGSPAAIARMLKFAAEKGVRPWIEKRPLDEVNRVVVDMDKGKARYRYVLVNTANGGKL
ncbi:hypothetical protein Q5752_004662 [Cryptotrichosporon argae]